MIEVTNEYTRISGSSLDVTNQLCCLFQTLLTDDELFEPFKWTILSIFEPTSPMPQVARDRFKGAIALAVEMTKILEEHRDAEDIETKEEN